MMEIIATCSTFASQPIRNNNNFIKYYGRMCASPYISSIQIGIRAWARARYIPFAITIAIDMVCFQKQNTNNNEETYIESKWKNERR